MTDMTYWIDYQDTCDPGTWFTAGFDEKESLAEAQSLALDFLNGKAHPRAAGKPTITKVRITQVVAVQSVIWETE